MSWPFQPLVEAAQLQAGGGGGGGGGIGTVNVLAEFATTDSADDPTTSSITVTAGRPVIVVFIDSGGDPTAGTPHGLSGAGQTWTEIYGAPVAGDDVAYTRMSIWTSPATSGGSGELTFTTALISTYAYIVIEFEPDGSATATLGTELEATTAENTTSNTMSLSGSPQYWVTIAGASKASAYGSLSATPRSGWTELSEQIAIDSGWLVGVHAQISPLNGDTDASVTFSQNVNIPLISIPVNVTGGGGDILDSEAVAVGSGLGSAVAAAIRAAPAATCGVGQVAAPPATIRGSEAAIQAGGRAEATAALVRSSAAEAVSVGIAAAAQAMIRSSPATAAGRGEAAAAAAAIRSSIAVALGGAVVEGHLTSLAYLVSVAVAIGGSHGQAPRGAILGAPAASIGAGVAQSPPALVRGSHASVVGLAAARAAASLILGSEGPAVGASALAAAAVLIRSAPAVALSLAGAEAAPALIRSGPASASGLAILAGLGILVPETDYSNWRLAFASEVPRTGAILNKARRRGAVLNPTRRGQIVELKE